jgi:hypothetical protein
VRWSFGTRPALDSAAARAYRLSKIGATVMVVGLTLWAVLITLMLKDTAMFGPSMDFFLLTTQVFGIVAFVGGLVLILLNLRAVWTGKRRWPARTWSVVLSISALTVVWVAVVFKLMSVGVNY